CRGSRWESATPSCGRRQPDAAHQPQAFAPDELHVDAALAHAAAGAAVVDAEAGVVALELPVGGGQLQLGARLCRNSGTDALRALGSLEVIPERGSPRLGGKVGR